MTVFTSAHTPRHNQANAVHHQAVSGFTLGMHPRLPGSPLALLARCFLGVLQANFRVRPVLPETLVDPARFAGIYHKAANWPHAGTT